ncbi:MAG TPA: class F sortase [Jatrophihabitantaceae bacterium]|jgi:hypothetical protein
MNTARLCIILASLVVAACAVACGEAKARPAERTAPASSSPAPVPAPGPRAATSSGIPAIPAGPTGPAHADPSARPAVAPPARLVVPAIGIDTDLESVGLLADGTLEPPHEWGVAGWYADGVRPGDPGPAVIEGHVDSRNGPAVFYRLRDLRVGATVIVQTHDGKTLRFVVDTVRSYPKTHFPTAAVYGPTPLPVLRLVTCTGEFDWAARSYLNNLVVSARLV